MSTFYVIAEVTMRPYFMESDFYATHEAATAELCRLPDNGNWEVYAIAGKPPEYDGPYEVVERPGKTGAFRNAEIVKWKG